jgi:uncharacterized protein YciI
MQKQHFFIKLNPPRPTFAMDMTEEEKSVMQRHIAYWKPYLQNGTMLVFGPVMDPAGVYGIGVICAGSEPEMRTLIDADPAASLGRYDAFPMSAVTKPG